MKSGLHIKVDVSFGGNPTSGDLHGCLRVFSSGAGGVASRQRSRTFHTCLREVEGVLEQGESLSEFVENAVRQTVLKLKHQAEFLRRGIAAIEETKRAGGGIAAEAVVAKLDAKLAAARRAQSQKN